MTRLELRTFVRKGLGDVTAAFWTDTEINSMITVACNDLAYKAKCVRTHGFLSTVEVVQNDTAQLSNEYDLSSTFPGIYAVLEAYLLKDGTEWTRLIPTTRQELDEDEGEWFASLGYTYLNAPVLGDSYFTYNKNCQSGIPTKYYWDREENIFGLYLPPNASNAGTDRVKVFYAKTHTPMTADGSNPDIPEPLHLAVIDHCKAVGFEQRGWGDKANDAWQKYFARIKDYLVERHREREDEDVIMRNYRNRR